MHARSRPTIHDVARAAGVSPTTVSHALNGKGVVSPHTVERVKHAATELGYRPSVIARGLQQSHFGLIALVIRAFSTLDTVQPSGVDYFLRLTGAASLAAMARGYSLMLVDDPTRPDAPRSALSADAYIIDAPFANDPICTLLHSQRIPFVLIGSDPARQQEFHSVPDRTKTQTHLMLDHLAAAGAERIAIVLGTDPNSWNHNSRASYIEWCAEHGTEPLILAVPEQLGEAAGAQIIDHFFANSAQAPDAIFCLTGRHAAGVNTAASERGIKVPGELLIAAASGSIQNITSQPPVTAIDMFPEALARLAVDTTIALLEGHELPRPSLPPARLFPRESTRRNT